MLDLNANDVRKCPDKAQNKSSMYRDKITPARSQQTLSMYRSKICPAQQTKPSNLPD